MEFLSILLMIILVIIVLNQNSKISRQLEKFEGELRLQRNQLLKFTNEKITPPEISTIKEADVPVKVTPPVKDANTYTSLFTIADDPEPIIISALTTNELQHTEQPAAFNITEQNKILTEETERVEPLIIPLPQKEFPKHAPGFFERHPDMEKFIGENLVNKIGIAILVLAIGFFVKYAIDQDWVGPVGRVSIGIFCGGILVALAHRMRNNYKSFSSVLAGGGLAVFYFTITLAYQQFHLFSQTTAFIIMIVITLFAVILSLLYNKQELIIIALVGGFAAPFLVSDGSNNYKALFIYLIILNAGLLVIAFNKAWRLLNLLSFIFTVILFGSWLITLGYDEPVFTYRNGFVFATIFYLIYFIINIAHNIREKKKFIASDFGILLAGTSLYFAAGLYSLDKMNAPEFKGLFSASMGIYNLAASYFLFRKQKADTNILYLLIGITLTFISITAPIQLHGNYITLFWASEAVLLYWLFTKARITIIQYASVLVWLLMLISLFMDWSQLYILQNNAVKIIVNKGFITSVFAAAATYLLFILRSRDNETSLAAGNKIIPHPMVFRLSAIVLLFLAGALEINFQFSFYYPGSNFNMLYLLLYTTLFLNTVSYISPKIKWAHLHWQTIALLLSVSVLLYLLFETQVFFIQQNMLIHNSNGIHMLAHWVTALLAAIALYRLMRLFKSNSDSMKDLFNFSAWIMCIVAVIYLSSEIALIVNNLFYSATNPLENIQRIYIKTGLPILWGVCSFGFMWLGMHYKYRPLRIMSLSLFTLTLAKLFIFDIRNIPAGGKIAAFFCLGILLLIVSFMYQRLKKIIIDNEAKVE
jgi:uncharacterized membrane protein